MENIKITKSMKMLGGLVAIILFIVLIASGSSKNESAQNVQVQNQEQNAEATTTANQEFKSVQIETKTTVEKSNSQLYKVIDVVDGDTIKVSMDGSTITLRLIGMDTPETVDPRKPVQCFGKEASNKAKELLSGKSVKLEADSTQGELDKYKRTLRYVFMEDGTFFNKWMIENGYAHEYTYNTPYKYQVEFKAAEKSAREAQRGLWNPTVCPITQPVTQTTTQTPPAQTTAQLTQPSGHTFYLSTYYTSKNYYCDTDEGWKLLSPKYLKSYTSEQALLVAYPGRTLHEPCK